MFYHFSQNNSGGFFVVDPATGISHHVIIEADNYQQANDKAEDAGLYFDGCSTGNDCSCCGDRWYAQYDDRDGTDTPQVYGTDPFGEGDIGLKWVEGPEGYVHYADGRIVGFRE